MYLNTYDNIRVLADLEQRRYDALVKDLVSTVSRHIGERCNVALVYDLIQTDNQVYFASNHPWPVGIKLIRKAVSTARNMGIEQYTGRLPHPHNDLKA